MTPSTLLGIANFLAVIACCLGGGLGGYVMARPDAALEAVGLSSPDPRRGLAEARAFGGLLLLGHAAAAAALGYAPSLGAVMAFAMAIVWLGAAGGRILSLVVDRPEPGAGPDPAPDAPSAWTTGRGLLSFNLLMAASLALPLWMLIAPTLGRHGVSV